MRLRKYITRISKTHWLFAIIALVVGFFFVFITPPLWGADEGIHFFRAYQISQGEVLQTTARVDGGVSNGGLVPASFKSLDTEKSNDIKDNPTGNPSKQIDDVDNYSRIGDVPIHNDKLVANPYGRIIYPAITYTAPALSMAITSPFNPTATTLLRIARIATLLLYVLLVASSLFLLRYTGVRWIVFLVALLPMSVFQASVVSADSLLLGLSLLFFSLLYCIYNPKDNIPNKYVIGTVLVAILIAVVKPPYVILTLVLLFLPLSEAISRRSRRLIRLGIPTLCLIVAALFAYLATRHAIGLVPQLSSLAYINPHEQLHWIILHPFGYVGTLINSFTQIDWLSQTIGLFGSSFIIIPALVSQLIIITLTLTIFTEPSDKMELNNKYNNKLTGIIFLGAGILVSLVVITTLYITWSHVGGVVVEGVQGRYFLPAAIFVLFGVRMLTRARLRITNKNATIFYSSIIVFCLVSSLLWYYKILY